MIRATGLAAATGLADGGVDGGGFWEGKTRVALQALLHAAIDRRRPAELFRWTLDPSAAAAAVAILNASPKAATGWAEGLEAMIETDQDPGFNLAGRLARSRGARGPAGARCRESRRG